MRKFGFIITVLCVGVLFMGVLSGCQKKHEALEEMQQPMSPEDLSRLANQTASISTTTGAQATAQVAPTSANTDVKMETLPPSGPYQPSAKDIQAALKNAGYYTGNVDGKIGPMTKKAIEAFQEANGLKADGKVGPKTWNALSKYLTETADLTETAIR